MYRISSMHRYINNYIVFITENILKFCKGLITCQKLNQLWYTLWWDDYTILQKWLHSSWKDGFKQKYVKQT